jgi:hypothetical protein
MGNAAGAGKWCATQFLKTQARDARATTAPPFGRPVTRSENRDTPAESPAFLVLRLGQSRHAPWGIWRATRGGRRVPSMAGQKSKAGQ